MKTVTTVTERKAIVRFVWREVKPPLAVGHRQWLRLGDAVPARAWQSLEDRQISVCRRCRGAIAIAEGA
jgi:hypothetical protein